MIGGLYGHGALVNDASAYAHCDCHGRRGIPLHLVFSVLVSYLRRETLLSWLSHNSSCDGYLQRRLFQATQPTVTVSIQSSGKRPLTCGHVVQADPGVIDKLAYYLWFAEYAYEAGTEPNLKKVLASRGKLFRCVSASCAAILHSLDTSCNTSLRNARRGGGGGGGGGGFGRHS